MSIAENSTGTQKHQGTGLTKPVQKTGRIAESIAKDHAQLGCLSIGAGSENTNFNSSFKRLPSQCGIAKIEAHNAGLKRNDELFSKLHNFSSSFKQNSILHEKKPKMIFPGAGSQERSAHKPISIYQQV